MDKTFSPYDPGWWAAPAPGRNGANRLQDEIENRGVERLLTYADEKASLKNAEAALAAQGITLDKTGKKAIEANIDPLQLPGKTFAVENSQEKQPSALWALASARKLSALKPLCAGGVDKAVVFRARRSDGKRLVDLAFETGQEAELAAGLNQPLEKRDLLAPNGERPSALYATLAHRDGRRLKAVQDLLPKDEKLNIEDVKAAVRTGAGSESHKSHLLYGDEMAGRPRGNLKTLVGADMFKTPDQLEAYWTGYKARFSDKPDFLKEEEKLCGAARRRLETRTVEGGGRPKAPAVAERLVPALEDRTVYGRPLFCKKPSGRE